MYLICVSYFTGPEVKFFGPFPSAQRATEYARVYEKDDANVRRWFVAPITVPYSVVSNVKWRGDEDNISA